MKSKYFIKILLTVFFVFASSHSFAKLIKDSINPNYEKRPYMETIKKRLDQINFNNDHK